MRKIGIYTVEDEPLGKGGMGQVLRGYTPDGRYVAIKEILPQFVSDPEYRVRIESEIAFLKKFDHPNVVHIYDHFELDGRLYIVMELVEGDNIEDYVEKNGAIPWKRVIGYMSSVLDAMEHVHQRDVIHRDIKPGNIMIRPDGSICILDFGVAKSGATVSSSGGHTVLGSIIGTDGYMSPEQAGGYAIDYRADIYALGCVMFYMLTGRHAYPRLDSDFETQYAILNKPFPRLKDVKPGFPPVLQDVIDKAVDRNMMKRYQSCAEFRDRLNNIKGGGTDIGSTGRGAIKRNIQITIGREECDIMIDPNNYRVSRSHATLTRKEFTGGTYYVFTDTSSNGTLIDNMVYTKGMSYNFKRGESPTILLAGDPNCRLDIQKAVQMLDRKAEEAGMADRFQGGGGTAADDVRERRDAHNERPGNPAMRGGMAGAYTNATSIFKAIANCFNRYADFKGRSGRGEFWYWQLFLMIVNIIFSGITYLLIDNYISALPMTYVSTIWAFCVLLPSIAVGARRFQDTGRPGWLYILLICLSVFVVPLIVILIFACKKSEPMSNKYGPGPMPGQMSDRR